MRGFPSIVAVVIATSTASLIAAPAQAQTALEDEAPEPDEAAEHRLKWEFPRFRAWQYVAIGVQTAANLTIEFTDFPSREETWRAPAPLDVEVRDALRAKSQEGRDRAALVSDVLWYTTQFYTVVVDSLLVPLAFDDGNFDVAWQMTMINWQVLGLTGIVTRAAHHSAGRARPSTYGCSDAPGSTNPCRSAGPGFFAGHVAMTSAGAALACAHHAALPLYGYWAVPGAVTCGTLIAGAAAVGALRIVADKHWVTDVIVGHIVGGGIGFGLPWLLHYQHRVTPDLAFLGVTQAAWIPSATDDGASLSLVGLF